jgi:hypothetical protein
MAGRKSRAKVNWSRFSVFWQPLSPPQDNATRDSILSRFPALPPGFVELNEQSDGAIVNDRSDGSSYAVLGLRDLKAVTLAGDTVVPLIDLREQGMIGVTDKGALRHCVDLGDQGVGVPFDFEQVLTSLSEGSLFKTLERMAFER